MSIVNLQSDYSNIPQFIDSFFSDGIRTITPINNAINNNEFLASFSTQNDKIKNVLLAAWQDGQGDSSNSTDLSNCPSLDKSIINFLASFVKENALQLSIPNLTFKNSTSKGIVCKLNSYDTYSFLDNSNSWDYSIVGKFLDLLIHGAHFVSIQSSYCLPNGPNVGDLYEGFQSQSFDIKRDPSNSHYATEMNINGYYYLKINSDSAPTSNCSFLLSLLFCITTANIQNVNSYESFFQLEGWQLPTNIVKGRNGRHSADYDLYKTCYWNISTYGASVYSEKRGTAIFLSPKEWIPEPTEGTFMPPYVGAKTPQKWLQTDLVTL